MKPSDDEIDALMAAEADRLAELLRMMPTTIAGCAAMMRWIETYSRDEANHSYLFLIGTTDGLSRVRLCSGGSPQQ